MEELFRQSFIINHLGRFFKILWQWYESSMFYKMFDRIVGFFSGLFGRSITDRTFTRVKDVNGGLFTGILQGFMLFVRKIFHRPLTYIREKAETSPIVCFVDYLIVNWSKIRINCYAMAGLWFSVVWTAVGFVQSGSVGMINIALIVVCGLGLLLNCSISNLYNSAVLLKFFDLPQMEAGDVAPPRGFVWAIALGAVVGVLTIIPGWYLAIGGAIGLIVLLKKPIMGVFMMVVLFPLLPTMAVAGLVVATFVVCFIHYIVSEKPIDLKIDGFDLAMLGMCFIMVYGVLNSYQPRESLPVSAIYIVLISGFFLIKRAINTRARLDLLLDLMVVVAAVVSLYGIYQQITGIASTVWLDTEMFDDISGRVYSTLENPNVLGEYLIFTISITLARMWQVSLYKLKFVYLCTLLLQLVCMVLTYSRGCWIALVVIAVVFLMCNAKKIIGLGVLAVCAVPFVLPENILFRLASIGDMTDSSTSYRVYIWQGTINMLKEFWITGVGIGEQAYRSIYNLFSLGNIIAPHPHNLFLLILSMVGIVGFVVFIWGLVCFFKYVGKSVREGHKILATALIAGMLGFLLQSMFDNTWYNYRIFFFYFAMLAIGASLQNIGKQAVISDE